MKLRLRPRDTEMDVFSLPGLSCRQRCSPEPGSVCVRSAPGTGAGDDETTNTVVNLSRRGPTAPAPPGPLGAASRDRILGLAVGEKREEELQDPMNCSESYTGAATAAPSPGPTPGLDHCRVRGRTVPLPSRLFPEGGGSSASPAAPQPRGRHAQPSPTAPLLPLGFRRAGDQVPTSADSAPPGSSHS